MTVFPAVPLPNPTNDWWQIVMGAQPEEVTTNFKEGSFAAAGPFDSGALVLQVTPPRIDWTLQQKPLEIAELEALTSRPHPYSVGPYDQTLPVFRKAMLRWLDGGFDFQITRFAFGAVLEHPEDDRETGYERLREYLRIPIPQDSSDFMYQINLPATRSFDDGAALTINRLSRWSVSRAQVRRFIATIGPEQATASTSDLAGPTIATHLELDFNTAPNPQTTVPLRRLPSLFDDLLDQGTRFVENGIGG